MAFCYSTDKEEFYGGFDTIAEAIEEGQSFGEEEETVWVGEVVHASEYIKGKCATFAADVIHTIDEYLSQSISGEKTIITMTPTALEEFGEVIFNYVKERADFERWGVKNISQQNTEQGTISTKKPDDGTLRRA